MSLRTPASFGSERRSRNFRGEGISGRQGVSCCDWTVNAVFEIGINLEKKVREDMFSREPEFDLGIVENPTNNTPVWSR